ncbi:MAG: hypothetical protein GY861_06010 [bacterium]|nr:hypothetical protein [bacterium]
MQLIRHRLINDVDLSKEEFENKEGSSCSKDYDQKKENPVELNGINSEIAKSITEEPEAKNEKGLQSK